MCSRLVRGRLRGLLRIDRALDAQHIYNTHEIGGGGAGMIDFGGMFGQPK